MRENIHSETYSLLIDTYIKDNEEKTKLFNTLIQFHGVGKKVNWALSGLMMKKVILLQDWLLLPQLKEFIFLVVSVVSLVEERLMPGLTSSNELISRDEGLHTDFAVLLYSMLMEKLPRGDYS